MLGKEVEKKYQTDASNLVDDYLGDAICDVQHEFEDVTVPTDDEYDICGM